MMYVKPLVIPMFPETIAAIVTAGFRWVHVIRPMTTIPKNFHTPLPRAITISPVVQTALQVKGQQPLRLQLHGSR